MEGELKILTLNCRGLQGTKKRTNIFNFLKDKKHHIYCLQDTHFTKKDEQAIYSQWGGEFHCSYFSSNSRGVAILFDKHIDIKIKNSEIDPNGNFVILDLLLNGFRFTLANIYGPNTDSPSFYENIFKIIDELGNESFILCGDFNCVINPELDYSNYKHINNKKAREKIKDIILARNLVDIYRNRFPDKKRFTWRKTNPIQQARLDFFLSTEDIVQFVQSCEIEPSIQSDHSIVQLHLKFENTEHGKGLWKHNDSLLCDINYINQIKNKISQIKKQYCIPIYDLNNIDYIPNAELQFTIPDYLFLDTMLMEIRGESISYGSYIKKKTANTETELLNKIKDIEEDLSLDNLEELNTYKNELYEIRENKLKGNIIRSKAKWVIDGEKPTNFFCNLEKHNYINKSMNKLESNEGKILTERKDIQNEIFKFYKGLYSNKDNDDFLQNADSYFNDIQYNKLNNLQSQTLEGYITYEEAGVTLKNMKNDKSPGSDGFTTNFFKMFWKDIGHFIVRAINNSYDLGILSTTQRQGIITCIPKDNKPRQFLKKLEADHFIKYNL